MITNYTIRELAMLLAMAIGIGIVGGCFVVLMLVIEALCDPVRRAAIRSRSLRANIRQMLS